MEEEGKSELKENIKSTSNDIEPVNMGKKKAGVICLAFIFVLLIVFCMVRGCSITRKIENTTGSASTSNGGNLNAVENSENIDVSDIKNSQNYLSNGESSSGSSSNSNSTKTDNSNGSFFNNTTKEGNSEAEDEVKKAGIISANDLREGDISTLSEELKTTAIVGGKSVYLLGNSYMYQVSLIIVTGNDSNLIVKYFCPKKTYDVLDMGTSVNVVYQIDSSNNYSISTISK